MSKVIEAASALKVYPLKGGPVSLQLAGLSRLAQLVSVGREGVDCAVVVEVPAGCELSGEWDLTCLEHEGDDRVRTFAGQGHLHTSSHFHRLGVALRNAQVASGTTFEFASYDAKKAWACQRYIGIIEGDAILISSSAPWLQAATLGDALELLRQGEEETSLRFETNDLASSLFAYSESSIEFTDGCFVLDGSEIQLGPAHQNEQAWLTKLASHAVLRTPAFLEAWDLTTALTQQQSGLAGFVGSLQAMTAQLLASQQSQAGTPPRDVIMKGRWSEFWTAELTEQPHVLAEDVADIDRMMAELGFSPAGALMALASYGEVAAGYTCSRGDVYGLVRADDQGRFSTDFRSFLEDGSVVITSTRPDDECLKPTEWLAYNSCPNESLTQLLWVHRQVLAPLGMAQSIGDLEGVARSLDATMAKLKCPGPT